MVVIIIIIIIIIIVTTTIPTTATTIHPSSSSSSSSPPSPQPPPPPPSSHGLHWWHDRKNQFSEHKRLPHFFSDTCLKDSRPAGTCSENLVQHMPLPSSNTTTSAFWKLEHRSIESTFLTKKRGQNRLTVVLPPKITALASHLSRQSTVYRHRIPSLYQGTFHPLQRVSRLWGG